MPLTAIIYESNCRETENAVKDLMLILGVGRHYKPPEFPPEHRATYKIYAIGGPVIGKNMDERVTSFVESNRGWLSSKKIFLFGMVSRQTNDNSHFASLKDLLGEAVLDCENIIAAPGKLDLPGLAETGLRLNEKAQQVTYESLPPEELVSLIEKFLKRHKYCTLCTAYDGRVRGTTHPYTYHNGKIYILWESSTQFANLLLNDKVCLALFAPYDRDLYPARMQLFSKAKILEPGSDAYKRVMEITGHDYEEVISRRYILWVIEINPEKVEFWWGTEWKRRGVGRNQTYRFRTSCPQGK